MEELLLPPGPLLLIILLLLGIAFAAGLGRRASTTIVYVPVDTRYDADGTGCLPLLLLGGVLLMVLLGLF